VKIITINPISFKYLGILKSEWLKGNMPEVMYDMGGNRLTKENVTNGHMLAKSKGGKTKNSNLMLETREYNQLRADLPFSLFYTKEGFERYCEPFKKIRLPKFNGMEYVKQITEQAKRLLEQGK